MFDTIKLCTGYKIGNRLIKKFPQNLDNLNKVVPVYKNFKSWKTDDLNKENPYVDEYFKDLYTRLDFNNDCLLYTSPSPRD